MKVAGILILMAFYIVYLGKMFLQKKQGIQTDQMAKNKKKDKVFYIEATLKTATYVIVPVEVISIFVSKGQASQGLVFTGAVIAIIGDVIFAAAVLTMKDSWRAGIAENDKTEMITSGIYRFSRNPAFLGFDCVYIGILLMFFNWVLLLFTIFAMVMLHLQILQEEKYLPHVFGEAYANYKNKVCRYIGRRN